MDLQERELCETRRLEPCESMTEPKERKEKRMSCSRNVVITLYGGGLFSSTADNSLTRRF